MPKKKPPLAHAYSYRDLPGQSMEDAAKAIEGDVIIFHFGTAGAHKDGINVIPKAGGWIEIWGTGSLMVRPKSDNMIAVRLQ